MKLQKKLTGAISLIAMITSATAVIGQEIKVWTTETQPARLERQAKMAAEYEASTGVKVEMIPVEESEMGTRATAAFAAGKPSSRAQAIVVRVRLPPAESPAIKKLLGAPV